ncbi:MAG: tRNA 2-thiouridine(34) synthase MnmA [Chloroflexi bacterium]|nr:tRNA 2-thiouridine(34) synthase MnmA [Chloroflexota bacterium]
MAKGMVIVAMSGGVDSAVAAGLLKEAGYRVVGIHMRLWPQGETSLYQHSCCSLEGAESARRVCQILGIPFYIMNFEAEFRALVVDYFCDEYRQGRTPNPCLACNHHIKFQALLSQALQLGADHLATGHYARIVFDDGYYHLLKAVDKEKDQSYVLYTLTQTQLRHLLFPTGEYSKREVRDMAQRWGLPVASRPDSQDICFVPYGDYRAFLKQRLPEKPGEIVDTQGNVLGRHGGIAHYTVGQRHGLPPLRRGHSIPYYVIRIETGTNRVVVGPKEELCRDRLFIGAMNFIGPFPSPDHVLTARVRYHAPEVSAIMNLRDGGAEIRLEGEQQAIAPGQALVLYHGDRVVGGGTIVE